MPVESAKNRRAKDLSLSQVQIWCAISVNTGMNGVVRSTEGELDKNVR